MNVLCVSLITTSNQFNPRQILKEIKYKEASHVSFSHQSTTLLPINLKTSKMFIPDLLKPKRGSE